MNFKIYQVDAFTDQAFCGNPAAVCLLNQWPEDETLISIAEENNLSETAFAVKKNEHYEIRWFTPKVEVDLCGHATLATAYVLFNHEATSLEKIHFVSPRSGDLFVTKDGDNICMDFPTDTYEAVESNPVLNQALKRAPLETFKGKSDYLLIYADQEEVELMNPDFYALSQIDARGVIISAPGKQVDFVSRFFAPQVGIDEDPVTGSAHTTLTPYWSNRLNRKELKAKQLSKRGGDLHCKDLGSRVQISGNAKLYMTGEVSL